MSLCDPNPAEANTKVKRTLPFAISFIEKTIKPPRRNPLITKTLYYSKNMEAIATGFKRIDAACKKVGVKYEFLREEYGFTVRFHRHCGEGWNQTKDQDVSGTRPEKRPDQQTKIEERANRVLELLTNAPAISRPAICEKLHLSDRQVRTAIDFLKANGKIHREGPAKGGKWIVD